jgi:hypothetical protein
MSKDSTKTIPVSKNTITKTQVKKTKLPTKEELQKALDENIENFQRKNELIRNRAKFMKTREDLKKFISKQGADFNEFMDDSGKKLVFQDDVNYRSEGLSINNNFLVREFCQFAIGKIEIKLAEIEKQILD